MSKGERDAGVAIIIILFIIVAFIVSALLPSIIQAIAQIVVAIIGLAAIILGAILTYNFELEKVDERHEPAGRLLDGIERDENVVIDHSKQFRCPKCEELVMLRHFFSFKHEVEVDECPGCGGIWLDRGELEKIRDLFETEEEKMNLTEDHFKQLLASEFTSIEKESQAKLAAARKVANIFRFV